MIRTAVLHGKNTVAEHRRQQVCAKSLSQALVMIATLGLTASFALAQDLPAPLSPPKTPPASEAKAAKPAKKPAPTAFLAPSKSTALSAEEMVWARAAWQYFAPETPVVRPQVAAPPIGTQGKAPSLNQGPAVVQQPVAPQRPPLQTGPRASVPANTLVPARAGVPVATMWSVGDQVAALVLARRMDIIDSREMDRAFSALLAFLNTMQISADQLPNRFYGTENNDMLGADLKPGDAGWSAVDVGRLLIWLRIAAEEYPQFAPYIRNAVARWNVCLVQSASQQLVAARPSDKGAEFTPETARGYDAYAAQGYRAWGMALPLPPVTPVPAQIRIYGTAFPIYESKGTTAPITTTPPAYLGLEFGFDPLAAPQVAPEEMSGGRSARDVMVVLHDIQAERLAETGSLTARSDFRRSVEPFSMVGAVMADGYPWSVTDAEGKVRPSLALVTTRAAFAMATFFDSPYTHALDLSVQPLFDPSLGWYEGRYEETGGYETTRTSATNAFVLEAIAYRHFRSLFPAAARPAELVAVAKDGPAACKLPLANGQP